MNRNIGLSRPWFYLLLVFVGLPPLNCPAQSTADRDLFKSASPSIVAVSYTINAEAVHAQRVCTGIVVQPAGLVMIPMSAVDDHFGDEQLTGFRILVPRPDSAPREVPATFQGRDPRGQVAFVRAVAEQAWPAVCFASEPCEVGDDVCSVGIMPGTAGYRPYLMHGKIAGQIDGETTWEAVDGSLAATGSPVFNAHGHAVGFVNYRPPFPLYLNDREATMALVSPPKFFMPTADFAVTLESPPTPGNPVSLGWAGLEELTDLEPQECQQAGCADRPAVRVEVVAQDSPADRAGLKRGDVIVGLDGRPLRDCSIAQTWSNLLKYQLLCMRPGRKVGLTVMSHKDGVARDVSLTLAAVPPPVTSAHHFWAKDLGLGVREMVPSDKFAPTLPRDTEGVVVTAVKPATPAALAHLRLGDIITHLNGRSLSSLDQFTAAYAAARTAQPTQPMVIVLMHDGRETTVNCQPQE